MDIQHRLVFVIHASISTGGQSMACPIQIQSNAPGRVPLSRGPISHDIAYITAVTEAEYKSWFEPHTIPGPNGRAIYLGCFCEDFWENWLCYNSTALYFQTLTWYVWAFLPKPWDTLRSLPLHNIYPNAYLDVLAQDCGNSPANVLELPQSCIKPSVCWF